MDLFGFSQKDITPEIGCFLYGYVDDLRSESIHDRLRASSFYFRNDSSESLMITCDVCSINSVFSEKMRKIISDTTGIKYENIILHGIHNHTGPNTDGNTGWGALDTEYCEKILLPQCLEAAAEAKASALPCEVGINIGKSDVAVNRREQDINNNVIFGQCEWGSYDPRMAVISFRSLNGDTVANLVYYTCHGTCAGLCKEISRDFSGGMLDLLEAHTNAPCAFFCGAEGDVGPRLSNLQTVGNIRDVEIMGEKAGHDAIRIFDGIKEYFPLEMSVTDGILKLPLKSRISENEAKKIESEFRNRTVNIDGQKRNYAQKVLASYREGFIEEKFRNIPQTAVKINNIIFVSFPYELFSDISLRINKAVTGNEILCLSNANGSEGYFPCDSEISKGGYEIEMFLTLKVQPFSSNADFHLIKETIKNLEDLICTE